MDNPKDITVLSLCAGYGGIELGLSRALENILKVVAVEIEAYALANLVAKAEKRKLAIEALWPDLRTFPAERFRGCFDFITAGYPCQPFSVAGKRKGESDPRHLWPHIARIIEAVRPVWFFGENVPGHLTLGFSKVYRSLRDMGYSVEAGLFTAAEVGVPHKRERLFILAQSSKCDGLRGTARIRRGQWQPCEIGESRRDLADTSSLRLQGTGHAKASGQSKTRWPARPGQPQYEWEEPRVLVANTISTGTGDKSRKVGRGTRQSDVRQGDGHKQNDRATAASELEDTTRVCGPGGEREEVRRRRGVCGTSQGQAQSSMGRTVDGTRNRVDRLRLLGNGVIPHQAERAFRELMR